MTREVELIISGLGLDETAGIGQQSAVEAERRTATRAEYFEKNGSHYLLYEEQPAGFDAVSKCRMKIRENYLELVRQGEVRTQMIFESGKTHPVDYRTPYGSLAMEIDTKKVNIKVEENALYVTVEYTLAAWGDGISDYKIDIEVRG